MIVNASISQNRADNHRYSPGSAALGKMVGCVLALAVSAQFAIVAGPPASTGMDAVITISNRMSLIHLGSLDSFDITKGGKEAAGLILKFLEKGDRDSARIALDIYKKIIPDENFGGEYTALQWFLE